MSRPYLSFDQTNRMSLNQLQECYLASWFHRPYECSLKGLLGVREMFENPGYFDMAQFYSNLDWTKEKSETYWQDSELSKILQEGFQNYQIAASQLQFLLDEMYMLPSLYEVYAKEIECHYLMKNLR